MSMANSIVPFDFEGSLVRVVEDQGRVWFIAVDVARVLGYRDASNMIRILDDDEKGTHKVSTLRGDQDLSIISESGIFHAALKSRRPEAVRLRRWVTGDLLPALRRDGHYSMAGTPASKTQALPPVRDMISLLDAIKKERAPAARTLLYGLLDQRCKASNVDTPPLDALGAASPENDIADAFFAALLELQHRGGEFSLHRNPAFLGVSLPSLRPLMNGAGIDCPPDKLLWKALRQHPAYEYSGNINCKDGKIRRCWVFRRADLFGFEPYATTSNPGA